MQGMEDEGQVTELPGIPIEISMSQNEEAANVGITGQKALDHGAGCRYKENIGAAVNEEEIQILGR